jgi:hypothetical protein
MSLSLLVVLLLTALVILFIVLTVGIAWVTGRQYRIK